MTVHDLEGYVVALVLLAAVSVVGYVLGAVRQPEQRSLGVLSWGLMVGGGIAYVAVLAALFVRGIDA